MSTWTSDELSRIGATEELQLASARRDGTLRKPVTIWVVPYGATSTSGPSTDPPPPGSVPLMCATKVGSGPAASKKTFSSSRRTT
jgi:hypothetical protein